jgi:hypothetical protein
VDSTNSTAPEHHSRTEYRRVWRFLAVLLSSCAECGTQDADYFARVPQGHPMFAEGSELCPECAADHGVL